MPSDFAQSHQRFSDRLGCPGTWWTSAERIDIAAQARNAEDCRLCAARKTVLSPHAVDGEHDRLPELSEPAVEAILAARRGQHPVEVVMDLSIENEDQIYVQPIINEDCDEVLALLKHPRTLATFSESDAHVAQDMGSSLPTHRLNYWVRERGEFTSEEAVRMLSFDNASAWALPDRGLVRTGYQTDLLLFDEAGIKPRVPIADNDLPGGSRRLVQKADGIAMTIANGTVSMRDGDPAGAGPL